MNLYSYFVAVCFPTKRIVPPTSRGNIPDDATPLMGARSSADEVERILFFSTSGSDFDGFDNVHLVFMYH